MADTSGLDLAVHIGPAFRDAFPTWRDLTTYLAAHATSPAFDTDRAIRQLAMVDLVARLGAMDGYGWILRGSLALPARAIARTGSPRAAIATVYRTARPAFDLDLCATTPTRDATGEAAAGGNRLRIAAEQIIDTGTHAWARHGIGLGGLVHYSSRDLRVTPRGRVVAQVTVQPLDPHRSSALQRVPVDDPISVHIDLSPQGSAPFDGEPEPAKRPLLALAVPGFADVVPDLYPTVNQIADKLALIAAPHWNPPWHRYKDLFDLHYLTTNCHITAGNLRSAIATNPNLTRLGVTNLPSPYRLHGQRPNADEDSVDWEDGYQRLRNQHPALTGYPTFADTVATLAELVDLLPDAQDSDVWDPAGRQWLQPDRLRARPMSSPATSAVTQPARVPERAGDTFVPASTRGLRPLR